ncbi:MAG TPA: PilZ domain-containing protein [Patescibacteria group bacterium]|nr:PilZ domain-containing protein [Patescibacteria group bacterium]
MTDKRQFPRIEAAFPVRIEPDFIGETEDLSEAGLRLALENPLLLSQAKAKIELTPSEHIETTFRVIWNKRLVSKGQFTYGVCFIRFSQKNIEALRHLVIVNKIQPVLDAIKEKDAKDQVARFFLTEVKGYLGKAEELNKLLLNNKIKPKEIEERLAHLNDFVVQKADELDAAIHNRIYTKKIKEAFRALVNCWTNKGLITKHALQKPRGYPGDYELIEVVYDKKPISEGIGFYYDKDFLDNEYAVGVRERKNRMKRLLKEQIELNGKNKLNILNLACGSCRELREMLLEEHFAPSKEVNFVCLDQDRGALEFARKQLGHLPKNVSFRFVEENVLNLTDKNKSPHALSGFDIIYNIGLADYLPDRVLKRLIGFCCDAMVKGGKFIIAHKDILEHKPLQPNWFCDWEFYPRTEDELLQMIHSMKLDNFSVQKEYLEPSCIFFLTLTKN